MEPGYTRLIKRSSEDINDQSKNLQINEAENVVISAFETHNDSFWNDVDETEDALRRYDANSIIDVLSQQLKNRVIPQYLDEFEVVIPEAEVIVGTVPLEEVQQREEQVEEARLRQIELESKLYQQREIRLAQQEASARDRVLQEARRRYAELVQKDRQDAETMQLRARRIGHVFRQAESHLVDTLKKQEGRVKLIYGSLRPSDVLRSRKRYRVKWARIPLLIRIRGQMLNAVKDKLPLGHYVMVATLYDKLGGQALHWTRWDSEVLGGATSHANISRPNFTRPFRHGGRFYHSELTVNQDMFVVCPPQIELRPTNTLVFELYQLSQATFAAYAQSMPQNRRKVGQLADPADHVVAWGALPLTTPEFRVVQGKFKLPLLRGEVDDTIEKFRDMEKIYQNNLSSWLCNFYFQVDHLPCPSIVSSHKTTQSKINGDEAFDVEIEEHSLRLLVPEAENNTLRKSSTMSNHSTMRKRSVVNTGGSDSIRDEEQHKTCQKSAAGVKPLVAITTSEDEDTIITYPKKSKPNSPRGSSHFPRWRWKRWLARFSPTKKTRVHSGDMITTLQNRSPSHKAMTFDGTINSESVSENQKGKLFNLSDQLTSIGEDFDISQHKESVSIEHKQQLDVENYTYSVNTTAVIETSHHQRYHTQHKLHYLRHELLVDLEVSKWLTIEFWRYVAMLFFACWIRVYVHYITQWFFLRSNRISVYDFQPRWTTCYVKYTWQSVATHTEIGLLFIGVFGNLLIFTFLCGFAALCQRFIGDLPAFGSNIIVCTGIATVLDPFLILLVDVLSHHYGCSKVSECSVSLTASKCTCVTGDWFKLYVRLQTQEGSGLVGTFITLILYLALTCLSLLVFYHYLLYIHMNGRMLDVYQRVHGREEAFFVPHDAEISLEELQAVCAQATRWKGPHGSQRRVFVREYALSDPRDPLSRETNTHVAVYNVEVDGTRQLHRHFLKMPDGAVLELFGKLGSSKDGNWKSDSSQRAASLALLYNILKDIQQDDNPAPITGDDLFDDL
ncbi:uncharacterized protein PHALS_03894 [Plasmopara halstedii]|uniref:Uncharacterized protein n=1 Tax=Plasmopara halstedii TaxID=4781 RepID=A0A0P1AXS9_PLAHL|nr:uncharacterized protein PHALS_03894 [Plasmopara halstedii]CEG47247.1 hypothetical protein PHALS_03894 [Plasmopara halstedii]|eukprot:XP_024583616.1 hypothetical protein PHALS_03894 [Plasmopara halstedii]